MVGIPDSPRTCIATDFLAIEAMEKYHVEKVCADLIPRKNLDLKCLTNGSQDIAQYIKKEVRLTPPPTSNPSLMTV